MSDYQHPYEEVDLPSGGTFYPEDHFLRSGKVDVKYLTAKEEDILTSTNLIEKGIVYDKLLESVVLNKSPEGRSFKAQDLLVGDFDALLIVCRILAYGKDYPTTIRCSDCNNLNRTVIDLSAMESKEILAKPDSDGTIPFVLNEQVTLSLKLLTRKDEQQLSKQTQNRQQNNLPQNEITSRLRAIIAAVNGDSSQKTITEFVDSMLITDSRKLQSSYTNYVPGPDFNITYTCEKCGNQNKGRFGLSANFFWPDS
ncbi:MAG: hypothetical protein VW683_01565 [Betaproteobacteria bacterium]|jgi:hypothetical protein